MMSKDRDAVEQDVQNWILSADSRPEFRTENPSPFLGRCERPESF